MESEEFKQKWYWDDKTLIDYKNFVIKEWEYIVHKYPVFEKTLKHPILPLKFILILACLKPITYKILLDAVWANIDILYVNKSERAKKEFNQTINKIFKILFQFTNTLEYKKMLVEKEVTGDDSKQLGNKRVIVSQNAILKHIERIKVKPLFSKEILDIQDNWENFIEKRYEARINIKETQSSQLIETLPPQPVEGKAILLQKMFEIILKEFDRLIDDEKFEMRINKSQHVNEKPELPQTLSEIFESDLEYKKIMEIFVSKQLIHPTYMWKDKTR